MTFGGWLFLLALALAAGVLAAMLAMQSMQRRKLLAWLKNPVHGEVPDGTGAWREVFSLLQRMRKDGQKRQTLLASDLERFRLAVQALPDGVILLDAEDRIEWLNGAACEHFSLDPVRDIDTLVGQLIRQTGFHQALGDFKAGELAGPFVIKSGANGSRRVVSITFHAFAGTGTLLLSQDISEIARTEVVRRDFIANVSHELRTPLTVITGFLEQMLEDQATIDSRIHGFLTLMAEQARRMNRLVEDLLTLSRLENTAEPPREDKVDVSALVQTLLVEARALSHGRHKIELHDVLPPLWIRGSEDEIRSAFGNLLSNAVRYTPTDGEIGLSWSHDETWLMFSVADNGIGIPEEHIARLTERFYRVDKGRSTATGGTGLGLAIVKHVLARHQGVLRVDSTPGTGSTFTACLPLERRLGAADSQTEVKCLR